MLLLTQVARAQGLQRCFEDAHRTLDSIDLNAAELPALVRVRHELERGRVFNSSGRKADATPHFLEAWELAVSAGLDALAVDAAHMIAIIETGDAVMDWNVRALTLAESSRDAAARKWRGSLLNNIGWTHFGASRYGDALVAFECATTARREAGEKPRLLVARWCVARTLRALGRVAEALAEQRALHAEHEAAGTSDAFVLEEVAECLQTLGQDNEASGWFALAHAALSRDPWLVESEPERIERLKRLSSSSSA